MKKNNMPLSIEELSKMNALECLWNCSKNHLNDTAIVYSADLDVANNKSKPLKNVITYRQLFKNITKTYNALVNAGVKKDDVVTFSSINTPEVIYTAYACVAIGCAFKPIDVRFNSDELLKQFAQTPSKIFVGSEPFSNQILPIYGDLGVKKIVMINFEESLPNIVRIGSKIQKIKNHQLIDYPDDNLFTSWNEFIKSSSNNMNFDIHSTKPEDRIHISATTGTTGSPKQLEHSSNNWNAQLYNASYCGLKFKRGEFFFNNTVPWVDFGLVNSIHTFLCNGIVLAFDPLWTDEKNAAYIVKNNPHWWMGAPGWLDQLFTDEKYSDKKIPNAKYFITGGAPLFPHKHLQYQEQLSKMSPNGKITPGYGFSEATAGLSLDLENKPETIGRMWPLADVELRDYYTGLPVKNDEDGELWVSAKYPGLSQIAIGYYNNQEANEEMFRVDENGKRWVRSGDKIKKNPDGTYSYISRFKNILTYNGYNINCDKIQERMLKIPGVTSSVVFGCVTSDGNQMPVICVELQNILESENVREQIFEIMEKEFLEYYKPKDVVTYEKFPTISMKTDIQSMKKELLDVNGNYSGKKRKLEKQN